MKKATATVFNPGEMKRLDVFISRVAAAEPLPGGGSVAALAGELAAALGEMMAGLTEDREKFLPVRTEVLEIHAKLKSLRNMLQRLVQEDSIAYKSLLDAIKLPRNTGKQKTARARAIRRAMRGATETPLRTARLLVEVLKCLKILIEIGNPNVKCDAAVGAQLACASLNGTQYNVLANISRMTDASYASRSHMEISGLVRKGRMILQRVDRLMAKA